MYVCMFVCILATLQISKSYIYRCPLHLLRLHACFHSHPSQPTAPHSHCYHAPSVVRPFPNLPWRRRLTIISVTIISVSPSQSLPPSPLPATPNAQGRGRKLAGEQALSAFLNRLPKVPGGEGGAAGGEEAVPAESCLRAGFEGMGVQQSVDAVEDLFLRSKVLCHALRGAGIGGPVGRREE